MRNPGVQLDERSDGVENDRSNVQVSASIEIATANILRRIIETLHSSSVRYPEVMQSERKWNTALRPKR